MSSVSQLSNQIVFSIHEAGAATFKPGRRGSLAIESPGADKSANEALQQKGNLELRLKAPTEARAAEWTGVLVRELAHKTEDVAEAETEVTESGEVENSSDGEGELTPTDDDEETAEQEAMAGGDEPETPVRNDEEDQEFSDDDEEDEDNDEDDDGQKSHWI